MSAREQILLLIGDACAGGARHANACAVLQLSVRTVQRWRGNSQGDQRSEGVRVPHNKLSDAQRTAILAVMNSPAYRDRPPSQIVPCLADDGTYLASESTLYRVLRDAQQRTHRLASCPCRHSRPAPLVATAANQLYSWDISYLPSLIQGLFFYLYFFIDIYSRKVVGWQVHDREGSDYAAELLQDIVAREGIRRDQLILHSDNGTPMKGVSMLSMMHLLGIVPSLSRPGVSDDNPYSESLFRTVKYAPPYPGYFTNVIEARAYFETFVAWYNTEHRHSGIQFVTPAQRHTGEDKGILLHRQRVYEAAKAQYPTRWNGRATRNWDHITTVHLNPEKGKSSQPAMAVAA